MLEPNIVAQRRLDFYSYFLLVDGRYFPDRHSDALEMLHKAGFKVNSNRAMAHNADEILEFVAKYEQLREKLPYEIDGIVIKVNSMRAAGAAGLYRQGPALGHRL